MISGKFATASAIYGIFIVLLWALRRKLRNNGLIDVGWPLGLIWMAIFFVCNSEPENEKIIVLAALYGTCGLRFVAGWSERTIRHGEDRRWRLWEERWESGLGPFGIKNTNVNFLIFYLAQWVANVFFFFKPLALVAGNAKAMWHPAELVALALWVVSFSLENLADLQLYRHKRSSSGPLLRTGLWKYSRHPNYFFEFLLWLSYALFASASAQNIFDFVHLFFVPVISYLFLAHYTGIPVTEAASLEKRGESYREYQLSTNKFFPWPPRTPQEQTLQK